MELPRSYVPRNSKIISGLPIGLHSFSDVFLRYFTQKWIGLHDIVAIIITVLPKLKKRAPRWLFDHPLVIIKLSEHFPGNWFFWYVNFETSYRDNGLTYKTHSGFLRTRTSSSTTWNNSIPQNGTFYLG